jgi:hypothetical protein
MHLLARPAKTRTQDSYQAISNFLSYSDVTRRSNKHNIQIYIADYHYIYNGVVGNMSGMYRLHTHYNTD